MFNNYSGVDTAPSAGAALDIKDVTASEAMLVGSGVIGAGVLGTALIIATYAAPAPVIGGTALALGLGVGSTFVGADDESTPAAVKTEAKPPVTDTKGNEVDVAGL